MQKLLKQARSEVLYVKSILCVAEVQCSLFLSAIVVQPIKNTLISHAAALRQVFLYYKHIFCFNLFQGFVDNKNKGITNLIIYF